MASDAVFGLGIGLCREGEYGEFGECEIWSLFAELLGFRLLLCWLLLLFAFALLLKK